MGCNEALCATPRQDPKTRMPAAEAAKFLANPNAPRRLTFWEQILAEPEWIDPNPPEEEVPGECPIPPSPPKKS